MRSVCSGSSTRSITYTRPLATVGPQYPELIGARHLGVSSLVANFCTIPVSRHTPSRLAPRHCGQSSAWQILEAMLTMVNKAKVRMPGSDMRFFSVLYCSDTFEA